MSEESQYCSWCLERAYHRRTSPKRILREVHICSSCHNKTVRCVLCNHMAKGEPKAEIKRQLKGTEKWGAAWNNKFCAEHAGAIASFTRASQTIENLGQYESIFVRDVPNVLKRVKYVGGAAAGVVTIGGVVITAGGGTPALAASLGRLGLLGAAGTGTAISSLTGVALTNASLAAIGGSVVAGTFVVSAVGLGLGGAAGAALTHQYIQDDPSFSIQTIKHGSKGPTVFLNGFLQQDEQTFEDWKLGHQEMFPDDLLYGVTWSAKTLAKLGSAMAKSPGKRSLFSVLNRAARTGSKAGAKSLNAATLPFLLVDMLGNPWHVAMTNAGKTGATLADLIARSEETEITLVGHSLGARAIYYVLQALATRSTVKIRDVILLGAAVGRTGKEDWERAAKAVGGSIYNCYSDRDSVLRYLYKFSNLGFSDPAGLRPIESDLPNKIQNIDCSARVDSHFHWKNQYHSILKEIYSDRPPAEQD